MKTVMIGLLAETPVHPGSGRSLGVVDLPVAREAATDYPLIPGSSLKGALRDRAEHTGKTKDAVKEVFGTQGKAGDLVVSDARLILLPVRSLTGAYRWVTCPHLLERYARDLARCGEKPDFDLPDVQNGRVLTKASGSLFLEERQFEVAEPVPDHVVEAVGKLIDNESTKKRLAEQMAVLANDDFAWFARYALPIQARNVLEDGTKKSTNLWYEETIPPDTVMYAVFAGRSEETLGVLKTLFGDGNPYLQAGGNETVGQGWFSVRLVGDVDGGGGA